MDTLGGLIWISLGVFACSILPGLLPIWIGCSRPTPGSVAYANVIGAVASGLIMGTAVSVIIPEGIHFLLDGKCTAELPKLFGVSINLGFVFMLVIDQIHFGDDSRKKINSETIPVLGDHRHHNHSTFIGLLVHSAADGVAMGAVSLSRDTSVEFFVFIALILHKGPASFALVTHLIQQNRRRPIILRNLIIFSAAAPIAAISTFILFADKNEALSKDRLGALMLFSAGTFLFVAVMHVLPETLKHEPGASVPWPIIAAVVFGMILPSFLSAGHGHSGEQIDVPVENVSHDGFHKH